jgi:hypothetical protein
MKLTSTIYRSKINYHEKRNLSINEAPVDYTAQLIFSSYTEIR